jgi:hypothetical protein
LRPSAKAKHLRIRSVSKNHFGIDVDHRRDHSIDFARNAGKAR